MSIHIAYADEFMETRRGVISDVTWDSIYRRYRKMERDLISLKEQGLVSTLSPAKMTVDDVRQYIISRKATKPSASTLSHLITALDQLCRYCGNAAVQECIAKNPGLKPIDRHVRLDPLSADAYDTIIKAYQKCDRNDVFKIRSFCVVLMSIRLGTRSKELRLAEVSDIDQTDWTFTIRHPKGEGSYGVIRTVPVPPDIRPVILDYLYLREGLLRQYGRTSKVLFCPFNSKNAYLADQTFGRVWSNVKDMTGLEFDLRACRRAFGQMYKDRGLGIEDISVLMGHESTRTTERFYARVSESEAIRRAKELW